MVVIFFDFLFFFDYNNHIQPPSGRIHNRNYPLRGHKTELWEGGTFFEIIV